MKPPPPPLLLLLLVIATVSCHTHPPLSVTVSPLTCDFPAAIFNLGDSNSDTGGLSASFGPLPPPYGETFFGMPAGRCSDGRLIIDFIAESLRFPYLSAYLDSLGANFSHGANFATGGSTITPQNITQPQSWYSPFSLDLQVRQFSQFKSRSQLVAKQGGVFKDLVPREDYFSKALYMFDIGQNDLTAGYFSNKSVEEFIPDAINRFSSAVKDIYKKGGRSFWIHNTGPLGCLTDILLRVRLSEAQLDSVGCGIPYNELAQQFNRMLNETVVQLRRELPLAGLTYVDVYSVKYSLFRDATKHGFVRPLEVCCWYGGGECNFDGKVNGTEVLLGRSSDQPSKQILWDGVHYTEAANRWVFDQISKGTFSDPPIPLSMACWRRAA